MPAEGSFLGLIQNAALLLALAFVFDLSLPRVHIGKMTVMQIPAGLLIASIGVAIMLTPWVKQPGLVFDTRSILLSVTGLFFGLIPTILAVVATIALRIVEGGVGMWMGIAVILGTSSVGLAWRHLRRISTRSISWTELYTFGVVVHVVMLAMTWFLPREVALSTLSSISLPVMAIYPVGTMLLGLLMVNRRVRIDESARVREDAMFLRMSEATAKLGHWVVDPRTNQMTWSDELWRIFGVEVPDDRSDPDEQLGRSVLAGQGSTSIDKERLMFMKPGELQVVRFRRPDTTIGHLQIIRGQDIRDMSSQRIQIVGVMQDVTERVKAEGEVRRAQQETQRLLAESNASRRALLSMMEDQRLAEQRLRESEERIRLAVTSANQGYFDLDIRTGSAIVSPEYATMIGYDPATFVETNTAWLDRMHPDDRPLAERAFKEYVAGLSSVYRVEFRQRTPVGKWKWIMSLGKIVERSEDGAPLRMLGTHTDLDERKRMEEELRETTERLRELAHRLETAREEERKQIARDIHDSLGQELTAIRMDLSLVSSATTPDEVRKQVAGTMAVADRAIATVRRISRTLRPDVLDQLGFVDAMRWLASDFTFHSKLPCSVKALEDDVSMPESMSVALFRTVQESLTNVARHGQATAVTIDFARSGTDLLLTVCDNGRGIRPADQVRRGSLGLVGMRERIRSLGGSCEVEPAASGGTCVTVRVPAPLEIKKSETP